MNPGIMCLHCILPDWVPFLKKNAVLTQLSAGHVLHNHPIQQIVVKTTGWLCLYMLVHSYSVDIEFLLNNAVFSKHNILHTNVHDEAGGIKNRGNLSPGD